MSPKASTFGLLIASQVIDSDSVPLITNAGDNKRVSIAEMRSVVGPGWSATINAALFAGATDELKIQAAIDYAAANALSRVFVPTSLLPYDATAVVFNATVQMVREGGEFSVYDVQAYGADPLGALDAGPAWNATRAAVPAAGGPVRVTNGTYALTTAFTFGSQQNVRLSLDAGVILTGEDLPSPLTADNNATIDLREGLDVVGGTMSVSTNDVADNATISGARLANVTGAVILNKWAAVGKSAAYASAQVGAFGHESTTAWTVDQATAAFVQVVPVGSTTLTTVWRWTGTDAVPKTDNSYSLGVSGGRFKDVFCYKVDATTEVIVGGDPGTITNPLRVKAAGADAAAFYRATNSLGGAASGIAFYAGDSASASNVVKYGGAQGYIDANTAGAHDGGVTFNTAIAGTVTNVWRILKGSFHPVTTNVYSVGTTALRPSTVFGVLGNFSGLLTAALGVTVTGAKTTLAATVAGYASTNLPHGTAPSAPVDGDMWTTTAGLYVRINGATVGPLS